MTSWTNSGELIGSSGTRLRWVWPGIAAVLLTLAFDAALGRTEQEILLLRWIRSAADHPVRVGLAVSLLHWALRPPGPDLGGQEAREAGKMRSHSL